MLKYLIVQLADNSTSFCHYPRQTESDKLITADCLRSAVEWAMKEDLTVQFLYPDFSLPGELTEIINAIDHADFVPAASVDEALKHNADVVIFDSLAQTLDFNYQKGQAYIIRVSLNELRDNIELLKDAIKKTDRLNIALTNVHELGDCDFELYHSLLTTLAHVVKDEYVSEHLVQFNILTDRLMLDEMNNCNAAFESLTLAPDGNLYVCPAFYISGDKPVGNLNEDLQVVNAQLYRLDHAPICRNCDAWHCRRCVWLNKKLTREVNTPGRQQCILAHLERAASAEMLRDIRLVGDFMPGVDIPQLDYLDPFDNVIKQQPK